MRSSSRRDSVQVPRILIIEDNPTNMQLMAYLLRAFGHDPIEAADGEAGVEAARRESPDLILCDVQVPKMDGYKIAEHLKRHPALRTIPLVAVTALAMVGDRDKVLAAGFDGYIAKPIDPETFVGQVEALLSEVPGARCRVSGPTSRTSHPALRAAHRECRTILMVDNSAVNRDLVRSTLEPFGYQIEEANTVSEAMELIRQNPPDLILSDLHMPGQNGYELIRVVKSDAELREIPFVFLSSSVYRDADRTHALSLGATRFIARPIDPEDFIREIEECLDS